MKLVGLMPVRNEDWILGLSARVALQWCDELVVLLHACTDRSLEVYREVMESRPRGTHLIQDAHREWDEMPQRQRMLDTARSIGATHIAMIDADEVLTANLLTDQGTRGAEPPWLFPKYSSNPLYIRPLIEQLSPGQMLELPGYNLRGSLSRYHSNGIWGDRWFSVAFKDCPEAHWAGDKFHSRRPAGVQWRAYKPIKQGEGGVMHLWGASERRLRAKHALYKVTERLKWPDKSTPEIDRTYNLWRSKHDERVMYPQQWPDEWCFKSLPVKSWWGHTLGPGQHPIDIDGEPWQEAEVRRLVQGHGRKKFAGLDLFGVA